MNNKIILLLLILLFVIIIITFNNGTTYKNNDICSENFTPNIKTLPLKQINSMPDIASVKPFVKPFVKPSVETSVGTSDKLSNISLNVSSNKIPFNEIFYKPYDTLSDEISIFNDFNRSNDKNKNEECDIEPTCNSGKCSINTNSLYPILDPKFNMREVAKQCLLLEDHLNNVHKRCYDCIKKHFLIIDGFLEEAISLEKNNNERNTMRTLYAKWIELEKQYAKSPMNSNNMDDISKKIRTFRKPLIEKFFDIIKKYNE